MKFFFQAEDGIRDIGVTGVQTCALPIWQKGHTEVYRGHELTVNLLRKVQLQIAVNEDFVEPTVNAIMEAGRTGPEGRIGDGKIFILPLEDCLRIRTGERGPEAI